MRMMTSLAVLLTNLYFLLTPIQTSTGEPFLLFTSEFVEFCNLGPMVDMTA